jgi:hypothetical protein
MGTDTWVLIPNFAGGWLPYLGRWAQGVTEAQGPANYVVRGTDYRRMHGGLRVWAIPLGVH